MCRSYCSPACVSCCMTSLCQHYTNIFSSSIWRAHTGTLLGLRGALLHSLQLIIYKHHFKWSEINLQKSKIHYITATKPHIFIILFCSLFQHRDRTELVIGDDNLVMLTITAVNQGEGAYETELFARIPPEADYIGVSRRVEVNFHLVLFFPIFNTCKLFL